MMTKKQFDILTLMVEEKQHLTQRVIATKQNLSLGTVNKVLNQLTMQNLVCNGDITREGVAALEPYKVLRAVIFAAGFGSFR